MKVSHKSKKKPISKKPGLSQRDIKAIARFLKEEFPSGDFTPKDIVAKAAPRQSPIHKYFDWNDTSAAEKWRLHQARNLVLSVVVEIDGIETSKYVSVKINDRRSYIETETARHIPDIWDQVLARAIQDAQAWAARYDRFKQLSPIIKTINKVAKEIRL